FEDLKSWIKKEPDFSERSFSYVFKRSLFNLAGVVCENLGYGKQFMSKAYEKGWGKYHEDYMGVVGDRKLTPEYFSETDVMISQKFAECLHHTSHYLAEREQEEKSPSVVEAGITMNNSFFELFKIFSDNFEMDDAEVTGLFRSLFGCVQMSKLFEKYSIAHEISGIFAPVQAYLELKNKYPTGGTFRLPTVEEDKKGVDLVWVSKDEKEQHVVQIKSNKNLAKGELKYFDLLNAKNEFNGYVDKNVKKEHRHKQKEDSIKLIKYAQEESTSKKATKPIWIFTSSVKFSKDELDAYALLVDSMQDSQKGVRPQRKFTVTPKLWLQDKDAHSHLVAMAQ
ncbi:hypothetical protein KC717_06470, partial [Candidatus Dojkabacteria bacterium]|nr:hypothetical protein [Candidatus Dojkabacteria bacterium]